MSKPNVILFAGPAGCGKTPVAIYLSWNLGLPIFNNDAIRREVLEDTRKPDLDNELHLTRRNERLNKLFKSKKSFILDASVDRTWVEIEKKLKENNYNFYLISFDISKELLAEMAEAKQYTGTAPQEVVARWFKEHELFLRNNQQKIDLSINDINYQDRLEICRKATQYFLKS